MREFARTCGRRRLWEKRGEGVWNDELKGKMHKVCSIISFFFQDRVHLKLFTNVCRMSVVEGIKWNALEASHIWVIKTWKLFLLLLLLCASSSRMSVDTLFEVHVPRYDACYVQLLSALWIAHKFSENKNNRKEERARMHAAAEDEQHTREKWERARERERMRNVWEKEREKSQMKNGKAHFWEKKISRGGRTSDTQNDGKNIFFFSHFSVDCRRSSAQVVKEEKLRKIYFKRREKWERERGEESEEGEFFLSFI